MNDQQDAYGHQVYDYLRGKEVSEIVERDDGLFDVSAGANYYFAGYIRQEHTSQSLGRVEGEN